MNDVNAPRWVIRAQAVAKTYAEGDLHTEVLTAVDLSVAQGETVAVVGASGSGKSTLLHLLGGLDEPSRGEIEVLGERMSGLNEAQRGQLRNRHLGFIYQFHHLLPEFTALENVAMPLLIRRLKPALAYPQARDLLSRVGLSTREQHKPGELSGGERQRVAVARALVTQPACILADEPTGNLDTHNAAAVFELMLALNRDLRTAMVVVTHDERQAAKLGRTCRLQTGRLTEDSPRR